MTDRWITLVGEMPAPGTTRPFAPGTSSRRRLEDAVGAEALDQFVLRNMYKHSWPDRFWDAEYARLRAARMRFRTPIVMLAGRRVAAAFGVRELHFFSPQFRRGRIFYVVPHPSGLSRWWNSERNCARARSWFSSVLSDREYLTRLREDWLRERGART